MRFQPPPDRTFRERAKAVAIAVCVLALASFNPGGAATTQDWEPLPVPALPPVVVAAAPEPAAPVPEPVQTAPEPEPQPVRAAQPDLRPDLVADQVKLFRLAGFCGGVADAAPEVLHISEGKRATRTGARADMVALNLIQTLGLDHKEIRGHAERGRQEVLAAGRTSGAGAVLDMLRFCDQELGE